MMNQTVRFVDRSMMARGGGNLGARCVNHPAREATHTWFSPQGYRWNTYCEPCAHDVIRSKRTIQ